MFAETGAGAVVAGVVGGLVGGVIGAVGGQAAVNSIWSAASSVLSFVTGKSESGVSAAAGANAELQKEVDTIRQDLLSSGVPSDQVEEFINLAQAQWASGLQSNPDLTLSDVAQQIIDNVQFNQQVAPTAGTGPTVAVEPTSSTGGQNVSVFDSQGNASADVVENADGSSSAVTYNGSGTAVDGASITPNGTVSETVQNPSAGTYTQQYTSYDGDGGQVTQRIQYAADGSVISNQTFTYDANGIETSETTTNSASNLDNAWADVQPTLGSALPSGASVDATTLTNDLELQGSDGDATQLFGSGSSGQTVITVYDVHGTDTTSQTAASDADPVTVGSITESNLAGWLDTDTGAASNAGLTSIFIPSYEGTPTSGSDSVGSPLDQSGSLTLPAQTEVTSDELYDGINQLSNDYAGQVYIFADDGQSGLMTPSQFLAQSVEAPDTGTTYDVVFADVVNGVVEWSSPVLFWFENVPDGAIVPTAVDLNTNPPATLEETFQDEVNEVFVPWAQNYVTSTGQSVSLNGSEISPLNGDDGDLAALEYSEQQAYASYFSDGSSAYTYETSYYSDDYYLEDDDSEYSTVFSDDSGDFGYGGGDDGGDFSDDSGADFPLVLNLAGKQVHTVSVQGSGVTFDVTGNGSKASTAWITPDEGFLVLDPDNKGSITSGAQWLPSFAMLASFDGNHNGILTAAEADAAGIKVWVDSNSDGVSESGEVYSLAALGIASINLNAMLTGVYDNGNLITADSTFTWTNGETGDIADTYLLNGAVSSTNVAYTSPNSATTVAADGTVSEILTGSNLAVDMGASGVNTVIDRGSSNTITAGSMSNATIVGGTDSILVAGSASNVTITGGLDSRIYGGTGVNVLVARYDGTSITTGSGTNDVEIDSDGNSVFAALGIDQIRIDGNSNVVQSGSNAEVAIDVDGSGNTIDGSGAAITIEDGIAASLNGSGNTIGEGSFAALTVTGANNAVEMTGAGSIATVSNGSVVIDSGVTTATVAGISDNITVSGVDTRLELAGTSGIVSMNNGALVLAADASVTLNGSDDAVTENAGAAVVASGASIVVDIEGAGATATLGGGVVTVESGVTGAVVDGSGNTITVAAGSALSIAGTGDTVNETNGALTLEANSSAVVTGSSDTFTETGEIR